MWENPANDGSVRKPPEQLLDLLEFESDQLPMLGDPNHPVVAYLNGLAPASQRPQLAALEANARRSTQLTRPKQCPGSGCASPTCSRSRPCLRRTTWPPRQPDAGRPARRAQDAPMSCQGAFGLEETKDLAGHVPL
jgi:hypothetical protein